MGRLVGTSRNDVFTLAAQYVATAEIKAGRGYDTLNVTGSSELLIAAATTASWRELEAIDFTRYTGAAKLTVNPALLAASNTGSFDIVTSAAASLTLSAPVASTASVNIKGNGHVQLSDATANVVHIASGLASVTGGANNDTIYASSQGSTLDGAGGNDVLEGGTGTDLFMHAGQSGNDTLLNFNIAQDVLDISGTGISNLWDFRLAMSATPTGTLVSFGDGSSIAIEGVSPDQLGDAVIKCDGIFIPAYAAIVTIPLGLGADAINALIADVPPGTTLQFSGGTYLLTASITIARDDITLAGAGNGTTTLQFDLPPGQEGNFISLTGGAKTYASVAGAEAVAGSNNLVLHTTQGLSVGDAIYIYQPNTQDYLDQNGWTNVSMIDAAGHPFREFITTITAIDGSTISLADALPNDFAATETRVFSIDMLTGISLHDLSITSTLGAADAYSFTNTLSAYNGASAISAMGTNGLLLDKITITNSPSIGLTLTSSIDAKISDITVSGSHNKGSEGNGYGVQLAEAFHNTFSGLVIEDMRHSVVFSAWNAETSNTIGVVFTNRDINFHGSPDIDNSVTVDRAVLDYNTTVDPSVWSIVSAGGTNHAATDIYGGNSVLFNWGEGHDNQDRLFGSDAGSYLNGHGSNDILAGGAGDDMLVGGLRRDTMTGGAGHDSFLLKMGDDLDTITDFKFGSDGDSLIFMGNALVDGIEDLTFTQDGANLRIRYGSNSTVILQNHTAADVNAANLVFDPHAASYNDLWNGL